MFPPALYVPAEDFERAFDILSECGFFDEPGADENESNREPESVEDKPGGEPDANQLDSGDKSTIKETRTVADNNDNTKNNDPGDS